MMQQLWMCHSLCPDLRSLQYMPLGLPCRRRFDKPTKDAAYESNEPLIRAAYVQLYRILKKHGMQLDFPIPDWVFKEGTIA